MKASRIITHFLVIYGSACAGKTPVRAGDPVKDTAIAAGIPASDSFQTGKVIDTVVCKSDPGQSYALYIPAKSGMARGAIAMPVIYFFDPHADGELPLNKYKSLADAYGFILAGSNNSKNGNDWPVTGHIWRSLFDDTRNRLRIDNNRIMVCGFSGGAKVAGYVALTYPGIRAVIANGAGLPDGTPAGDFSFSFTAIAGQGDMNLTDLVAISNELDSSRTRHRIIFFDGKHEWAPANSMELAFAGLQFDAMEKALIPKDGSFIDHYITKSKKRVDAWFMANQLIKAEQECKLSVSLLEGLTGEVGWFREKAASLARNALYQKQLREQEELLAIERDTKEQYMQHFQQADLNYWSTTISGLQTKANAKTPAKAMYQRLLAYLSLAFYSISNHLIDSHDDSQAGHFVTLYKMADPDNSEAWYFSALLNARGGHAQAARDDLSKAVSYGFRDEKRMMQQPEFQNIGDQMDLSRIRDRMHAPPINSKRPDQ